MEETKEPNFTSNEFMLAEYNRLRELFIKSEEDGHTRLNLFITLTTGLMGAFGITRQIVTTDYGAFFLPTLFALFLLGIFFLRRIIHRNVSTDALKVQLDLIRSYFVEQDHSIQRFLYHSSTTQVNYLTDRIRSWIKWYTPGTGGYGQIIVLLNTAIFAFIVIITITIIHDKTPYTEILQIYIPEETIVSFLILIIVLPGSVSCFYLQYKYLIKIYRNEQIKLFRKKKLSKLKSLNIIYPNEQEFSLIVFSEKYEKIMNDLEIVEKIKDTKLLKENKEILLEDSYYDIFPGALLQSEKYSLRLRKLNGKYLLAVKGPTIKNTYGNPTRIEIEEQWSANSLNNVFQELGKILQKKFLISRNSITNPEEYLDGLLLTNNGLNLRKIQARNIHRKEISLIKRGKKFGDLFIDRVTYVNNEPVNYCNIEIEINNDSKGVIDSEDIEMERASAMSEFKDNLLLLFYPHLREWKHSKFTTGKAIENLIHDNEMLYVLDTNNYITTTGFIKIDEMIKKGSVQLTGFNSLL